MEPVLQPGRAEDSREERAGRDAAGLHLPSPGVSSLRRGSTLVAFAGSLWLFKEANGRQKIVPVIGIVAGIVLTVVG